MQVWGIIKSFFTSLTLQLGLLVLPAGQILAVRNILDDGFENFSRQSESWVFPRLAKKFIEKFKLSMEPDLPDPSIEFVRDDSVCRY